MVRHDKKHGLIQEALLLDGPQEVRQAFIGAAHQVRGSVTQIGEERDSEFPSAWIRSHETPQIVELDLKLRTCTNADTGAFLPDCSTVMIRGFLAKPHHCVVECTLDGQVESKAKLYKFPATSGRTSLITELLRDVRRFCQKPVEGREN